MNDSDNEVKYVNKDAVYNKDGERKSFSELKTIFKVLEEL